MGGTTDVGDNGSSGRLFFGFWGGHVMLGL